MKFAEYIFILLILVSITGCSDDRNSIVAEVENYPITAAELKYWMLLEKANVYSYYYRKYKVEDSDNFWRAKLGDEIPIEKLKKAALQEAIRCKVQQIQALEKGIVHTINFDELVSKLDSINTSRMEHLKEGNPIYGPKQYTERTYFLHVFDKMVLELKSQLARNELKPGRQNLVSLENDSGIGEAIPAGLASMHYVDKYYDKYIDELVRDAQIVVNRKAYERLKLD